MTFSLLTDIPECTLNKFICARVAHSKCAELPGSYYCACDRGYVKDYTGQCRGRCATEFVYPGPYYCKFDPGYMKDFTGQCRGRCATLYVYPGLTTVHLTQDMWRTTQASVDVGVLYVYQGRTNVHVIQAMLKTTQASKEVGVVHVYYSCGNSIAIAQRNI